MLFLFNPVEETSTPESYSAHPNDFTWLVNIRRLEGESSLYIQCATTPPGAWSVWPYILRSRKGRSGWITSQPSRFDIFSAAACSRLLEEDMRVREETDRQSSRHTSLVSRKLMGCDKPPSEMWTEHCTYKHAHTEQPYLLHPPKEIVDRVQRYSK